MTFHARSRENLQIIIEFVSASQTAESLYKPNIVVLYFIVYRKEENSLKLDFTVLHKHLMRQGGGRA